jgi:hypothetical protein
MAPHPCMCGRAAGCRGIITWTGPLSGQMEPSPKRPRYDADGHPLDQRGRRKNITYELQPEEIQPLAAAPPDEPINLERLFDLFEAQEEEKEKNLLKKQKEAKQLRGQKKATKREEQKEPTQLEEAQQETKEPEEPEELKEQHARQVEEQSREALQEAKESSDEEVEAGCAAM